MDDKNLMENILLLEKGVCDLYMHGTIEASTDNVHQAFSSALNEAHCMQDTIYDEMAAKGWYPTEQADQSKINSLKQKFSMQAMQYRKRFPVRRRLYSESEGAGQHAGSGRCRPAQRLTKARKIPQESGNQRLAGFLLLS